MAEGWYWWRWKREDEWVVVWMDQHAARNPGTYVPIQPPTEGDLRGRIPDLGHEQKISRGAPAKYIQKVG